MATLTWTLEAEDWLRNIYEYIAEDNPRAAANVVDGIYERAQLLATFPEMGYRYEPTERNVRVLLYGHYRIAYLVKDSGDVAILGVFHGALQIDSYLIVKEK